MSAERCAQITLRAASRRRREVWMGLGGAAAWLKLLAPRLLDWLAVETFMKPAMRRGDPRFRPASLPLKHPRRRPSR
jgi:hypothetical protein